MEGLVGADGKLGREEMRAMIAKFSGLGTYDGEDKLVDQVFVQAGRRPSRRMSMKGLNEAYKNLRTKRKSLFIQATPEVAEEE